MAEKHIPECPAGRDRDHVCICEVLRMVRLADRNEKAKEERDRARHNQV